MKFKWPWTKNAEDIAWLRAEVRGIKQALIDARVYNFVMVKNYRKGDKLVYEYPKSIKSEDLLAWIEKLEL